VPATPDPSRHQRRRLQHDTLTGFLGFFAFLAVIQAAINVVQPEPQVWPALLALVLVALTWWSWKTGRREGIPRRGRASQKQEP
jgi:Flp pilus assembly protein TadB